jgi:hypothetical protein
MYPSIRIDILNPKAMQLLQTLVDLNLISIDESNSKKGFSEILKKLRSQSNEAPNLEEITHEVEKVRSKRYGK